MEDFIITYVNDCKRFSDDRLTNHYLKKTLRRWEKRKMLVFVM